MGVWIDLKNDNFDFQIHGKITPLTKVSGVSTYQPMRRTLCWMLFRGYLRASSAPPPVVGLSPAADQAVPFVACCTPVACRGQRTSCPSSSPGHRYLSVTSLTQTEADLPRSSKGTIVAMVSHYISVLITMWVSLLWMYTFIVDFFLVVDIHDMLLDGSYDNHQHVFTFY